MLLYRAKGEEAKYQYTNQIDASASMSAPASAPSGEWVVE